MVQKDRDKKKLLNNLSTFSILGMLIYSVAVSALGDDYPDEPVFNTRPNNVTFNVGDTATLSCSVRWIGTRYTERYPNIDLNYYDNRHFQLGVSVYWMRMSEPNPITVGDFVYSPDTRFSLKKRPELFEWNLEIKNVRQEDSGVYFCAVSSGEKREKYRRPVVLTINEEVVNKHEMSLLGTEFVNKGDPIKLECNITGSHHVPDEVHWFKDGITVRDQHSSRMNIINFYSMEERMLISKLVLKRSFMSDAGVYMCRGVDREIASMVVHVLDEGASSYVKRGTQKGINGCDMFSRTECTLISLVCICLHFLVIHSLLGT